MCESGHILLRIHNGLSLPDALMTLILSFMVFSQIKLFGMGVSMLRMTAAIDRTVETEQMPHMDENGRRSHRKRMTSRLST